MVRIDLEKPTDSTMDDENNPPRKTTKALNTHLNAPLKTTLLKKILNWFHNPDIKRSTWSSYPKSRYFRYKNIFKEFKGCLKHSGKRALEEGRYTLGFNTIVGELLEENKHSTCKDIMTQRFFDLLDITIKNLIVQEPILTQGNPESKINWNEIKSQITRDRTLLSYFIFKEILEDGCLLSAVDKKSGSTNKLTGMWKTDKDQSHIRSFIFSFNLRIIVSTNFCLINFHDHLYLGSRDHFLGLADIYSQRFNVLFSGRLALSTKDETLLNPHELLHLFSIGDRTLKRYDNQGFSILGKWEALCVGTLLTSTPDDLIPESQFLRSVKKSILDSFPDYDHTLTSIETFLNFLFNKNPNKLTQACGLFRIWGHPSIDSTEGIYKLKKIATRHRSLNIRKANKISFKFKEYLCTSYFKKNGKYPNLDITSLLPGSYIRRQIATNDIINKKHKDYELGDWRYVKGLKTFHIPKSFDISELIADKSMSLTLPVILKKLKETGTVGNSEDRSVLLNWIKSELADPQTFLDKIEREGFPEEESAVGVCPKERELKIAARLFALMPLTKRMYVVLTEALIAENILPYFPEITMLDSFSELLSRQYRHTSGMKTSLDIEDSYTIIVNMDFEKWNSNMRKEETEGVFQFMDQLHGFSRVFSRTHELFGQYLYLVDPDIDLKGNKEGSGLSLDDNVWTHHLGGLEGMRQKGWTVWQVIILKMLMEESGVRGTIMGQGDNQVLITKYPKYLSKQEVRRRHKKFMLSLSTFLSDIGPPLKMEETWESSNLFLYGKFPILKGVALSASQKKMARLMRTSNDGFPTLESALSSLSAGFFDSSSQNHSVLIPFMLYTFIAGDCIRFYLTESFFGGPSYLRQALDKGAFKIPSGKGTQITYTINIPEIKHSDWKKGKYKDLISHLLLFPRCLGGYPISLIGDVMTRGFPDPLTLSLSQLKLIQETTTFREVRIILKNVLKPVLSPVLNYEMLFTDPVSINILHPSSPGEQIKRLVLTLLKSNTVTKSQTFKSFLDKTSDDQQKLSNLLATMKPFVNPKIGHDILNCTVESRANKITSRIEKTSTLSNLLLKNFEGDLNYKIKISEINYLTAIFYQMFTSGPNLENFECSTNYAQHLRDKSWRVKISGVTFASPIEAFKTFPAFGDKCTSHCTNVDSGKIKIKVKEDYSNQTISALGPFKPFFGTATKEKILNKVSKRISKDAASLIKNCSKVLRLINWGTSETSNLGKLLISLFKSVTDTPWSLMIPSEEQISGSYEHRWNTNVLSSGCYLPILYNYSSWIYQCTSSLTAYSKGGPNVNLMFQSPLIFNESALSNWTTKKNTYHSHIKCNTCIKEINEDFLDIDPIPYKPKTYPGESQFWADYEDLNIPARCQGVLLCDQKQLLSSFSADEIFINIASYEVYSEIMKYSYERLFDYDEGNGHIGADIPNSWVFRLKPDTKLLDMIVDLLILDITFSDSSSIHHNPTSFWQSLATTISSRPIKCFSPLLPLVQREDLITEWAVKYDLQLPTGNPPTSTSWLYFIRSLLSSSCIMKTTLNRTPVHPHITKLTCNYLWRYCVLLYSDSLIDKTQLISIKNTIPWKSVDWSDFTPCLDFLLSPIETSSEMSSGVRAAVQKIKEIKLKFTSSSADYWAHQISVCDTIRKKMEPLGIYPDSLKTTTLLTHHGSGSLTPQKTSIQLTAQLRLNSSNYDEADDQMIKSFSRTGSCIYKSWEFWTYFAKHYPHPSKILVVGDGNGGYTSGAWNVFPKCLLGFNTLFDEERIFGEGVDNYLPSEFYNFPELIDKVTGLSSVKFGISDLFDPKWSDQDEYQKLMNSKGYGVIFSDTELSSLAVNKTCELLFSLLKHAKKLRADCLCFKAYLSTPLENINIVTLMNFLFADVKVISLETSNFNSQEVIIIGSFPKKSPVNRFFLDPSSQTLYGTVDMEIIDKIRKMSLVKKYKDNHTTINSMSNHLKTLFLIETPLNDTKLIIFKGKYPLGSPTSLIDSSISKAIISVWKAQSFTTSGLLLSQVRQYLRHHLILLGGMVTDNVSLKDWFNLHKTHGLLIYLNRSGRWSTVISRNIHERSDLYHFYPISHVLKSSERRDILKTIGRCQHMNLYKDLVYDVTLQHPTPISCHASKRKTETIRGVTRINALKLPADYSLSFHVFFNDREPSVRFKEVETDHGMVKVSIEVTDWLRKQESMKSIYKESVKQIKRR